jgi:hypothetical protein
MAVENMEAEQFNTAETGVESPERGVEDYSNLQEQVEAEFAQRAAFELEGERGSDFQAILSSFSGHVEMFVRDMEERLRNATNHKLH